MNEHVVLIPTYNEADSIGILLKDLLVLDVDIIVIDDDSPDKTAQIVIHANSRIDSGPGSTPTTPASW
jgi:glycosyltransferase involved in cell wall biosynthesis